jgi:hypothetical protein
MKMIKLKQLFLLILFIIYPGTFNPQSKDPEQILNKVKKTFEKIEDYEVDVHLKIDVPFLKMPESDAKLFFKQPDKIHVESEKFAMLPKEGLNFSPMGTLDGDHTTLYEREDTIQNVKVSVIKLIPIGNDNDIILTTFWIDQKRNLILKVESSRRPTGTFSLEFKYRIFDEHYELPSSMVFTFTVEKMMFRRGMEDEIESEDDTNKKDSGPVTGKVYLSYSNYKVNRGLPDELFESDKKKAD